MKFKFSLFSLSLLAVLASTVPADAGYVTSNGTVQLYSSSPDPAQTGANPPLTEITQLSLASGRVFTNQVNGAPFALGSTIYSVGTMALGQALNGDNLPVSAPDLSSIQIIFAVEGTIVTTGPSGATARFTDGSIWFVSRTTDNPGGLQRDNPLSWNFDDVFAKFDLAPQGDIIPGSVIPIEGGLVAAPAASTNLSSVNALAGAVDGIFVFLEDLGFTPGGAFSNPGMGTFVGSSWLRDVQTDNGGPPNPLFEGLAAFTDQTLNSSVIALNAAQIAALDAISIAGFGDAFSTGGYTPTAFGVGTGDFNADLSAESYIITAATVPEPSSLAIFGIGFGVVAVASRLRRGRKV